MLAGCFLKIPEDFDRDRKYLKPTKANIRRVFKEWTMPFKNRQAGKSLPLMLRFRDLELHRKLKRVAKENGRSLNSEIVARLSQSFNAPDMADVVRKAIADNMPPGAFQDGALLQRPVEWVSNQASWEKLQCRSKV